MFFFDPMYFVFAIPGLLLAMWAQGKVRSTFGRYAQMPTASGVRGADAARVLMQQTGVHVGVERIPGQLTDHYDPGKKVIRLSDSSLDASVASVAVVAHEMGHAEQDAQNYAPLKLRGAIVPAVQVASWVGPLIFLAGFMLAYHRLAVIGLICFAAGAVFSLLTLPVEYDASRRALKNLETSRLLQGNELVAARQVLSAAALTYVAAAAQSILTLLFYISLVNRGRSRSF
jgi:Zn-dependent membrane protease YugP